MSESCHRCPSCWVSGLTPGQCRPASPPSAGCLRCAPGGGAMRLLLAANGLPAPRRQDVFQEEEAAGARAADGQGLGGADTQGVRGNLPVLVRCACLHACWVTQRRDPFHGQHGTTLVWCCHAVRRHLTHFLCASLPGRQAATALQSKQRGHHRARRSAWRTCLQSSVQQ